MPDTIEESLRGNPSAMEAIRNGLPASVIWRTHYAAVCSSSHFRRVVQYLRQGLQGGEETVSAPSVAERGHSGAGEASVPAWAQASSAPPQFRIPSPIVPVPLCTEWLRLTGDFALLSDLHIPFHRGASLERFMTHAHREGLRRCLIIGDIYDFNQFNRRRGTMHQRKAQDDIKEGKAVFKSLLECFEEIICLQGNHDQWLQEHMRNHFDADFLMSGFHAELGPRLKWSNYGQAEVESGGKTWRALHGANYSAANPLGVAKSLCSKFLCNVCIAHQHHAEDGYDLSGSFQAVVLGGVYDSDRMGYLHYQPKRGPMPTRSYGLLKEGYCLNVKDV